MLVKPAYTCLVAQVVRAPIQCSEGCKRHNLAVCLPAYLSVHLSMTICLAVLVLCSFNLFCMPVLLDYLEAQVVRVPDPIGDTFIFFATIVCSYYYFFVYMHFIGIVVS